MQAVLARHPRGANRLVTALPAAYVEPGEAFGRYDKPRACRYRFEAFEESRGELAIAVADEPDVHRLRPIAQNEVPGRSRNTDMPLAHLIGHWTFRTPLGDLDRHDLVRLRHEPQRAAAVLEDEGLGLPLVGAHPVC